MWVTETNLWAPVYDATLQPSLLASGIWFPCSSDTSCPLIIGAFELLNKVCIAYLAFLDIFSIFIKTSKTTLLILLF